MLCPMVMWGIAMDIVWTDLNPEEQRAIAALGAGFSIQVCNKAALKSLRRAGLVRSRKLTPEAEQLRKEAILHTMAA
jgi:hypothetical protein